MHKSFLNIFIICAFALQGLMPAGFMPSFDNGKVSIVICTANGEKTIELDGNDFAPESDEHKDQSKNASHCSFALASGATVLEAGALEISQAQYSYKAFYNIVQSNLSHQTSKIFYLSTGPPTIHLS